MCKEDSQKQCRKKCHSAGLNGKTTTRYRPCPRAGISSQTRAMRTVYWVIQFTPLWRFTVRITHALNVPGNCGFLTEDSIKQPTFHQVFTKHLFSCHPPTIHSYQNWHYIISGVLGTWSLTLLFYLQIGFEGWLCPSFPLPAGHFTSWAPPRAGGEEPVAEGSCNLAELPKRRHWDISKNKASICVLVYYFLIMIIVQQERYWWQSKVYEQKTASQLPRP